jgi:HK97 family phage portal protein
MELPSFIKNISDRFRAKRYLGFMSGNLPVSSRSWGSNDFLNALELSLYTNKAIGKRADKVGEIEFVLEDAKGNTIEKDPLLDLLYKPNKLFSGIDFWKLYQKYYDTIGEVYIMLESERQIFEAKHITAMHLLIPTAVKPYFNKDGSPEKFVYSTSDATVEYKPEQIIYIHNPDPKSPLRGQSLLKAGVAAIQTEIQVSSYHSRILENGGKVEGVFKFKTGPLTENQLAQIKDKYQKEYGEAKKAGLPLFLGGDADYIKTGLSPDELSFLEAKKTTLEDICILTGVPKSMLASTSDVKFDNADADRSIFLRETIVPLLKTLTVALDTMLFPDDRNLTFVDPTPENTEEKRKNIETANTINALTTNEKRELLAELGITLDPIGKEGDDILIPFSLAPLGAEPAAPAQDPNAKGIEIKEIEHPLRDYDMRRLYWGMQIKRMDAREKKVKNALKGYFDDQEARIIEKLSPTKNRYFRKTQLDELLSIEMEVKIGKKIFVPILTELLKQSGIDAIELAGSKYDFILKDEIKSWLENRADIFLNKINETTFAKLQDEFKSSLEAEEGREGLISRIQDAYGGIQKSRAGLIARTETHNATQYGTMQGYKQGGLTTKIWVAVLDGATRDSHAAVDGEERPLDRAFSNGLMFPGDPRGDAGEVINCRCVI